MSNFEKMGSADDTSTWDLTPMDETNKGPGVEHYVSPEIEEWRRVHGISVPGAPAPLEMLGGEKGDWLVDANDKAQVNAAEDMLSDDAKGWTLQ